ncbi:MAG: FkbM family methyltransferase [Candidatus Woesearchaeota archaeon]
MINKLKQKINKYFRKLFSESMKENLLKYTQNQQIIQKVIQQNNKLLKKHDKETFRDSGFGVYSQTDEDGLLYIFSIIGHGSRKAVEIGAGNGIKNNTANLVINHGWDALMIDGNDKSLEKGRQFYSKNSKTRIWPPKMVSAHVTAENINNIISENNYEGKIDLLSLDIDGMDYWILKAINVIEPRVIVVEYQDILGPERSWCVPYDSNFLAKHEPNGDVNYGGASLKAFNKLLTKRDYRLVGTNIYGFNAFFIKNSEGDKALPEIEIENCFSHPKVKAGMRYRFPKIKNMKWEEV